MVIKLYQNLFFYTNHILNNPSNNYITLSIDILLEFCFSDSAGLNSTADNSEERHEETKTPSHLGPPSFSPPPLPSNILSDSHATNEQDKEAFTGTNGYNSVENEKLTANKLTNGDLSDNIVSNHAPR